MIFIVATIGLFAWYLLAMFYLRRKRALREKGTIPYFFVVVLVELGLVTDVLYNMVFGTILFLDLPRELTLSQRLARIKATSTSGWRKRLASYICANLLNPYDPDGHHC